MAYLFLHVSTLALMTMKCGGLELSESLQYTSTEHPAPSPTLRPGTAVNETLLLQAFHGTRREDEDLV